LSRSAAPMIWPDRQYALRHALGEPGLLHRMLESGDKPSIVVTDLPATSETCVWHENARLSSMCTMQALAQACTAAEFVPVSFKSSRITHSNGSLWRRRSVVAALPFARKAWPLLPPWTADPRP
jgi:hypothetical protein